MVVDDLLHERLHLGVAELGLGLSLKLWLGKFHAHDGRETFSHILATEVVVLLFEDSPFTRKLVDKCGECCAETLFVSSTLSGIDRIGERVNGL